MEGFKSHLPHCDNSSKIGFTQQKQGESKNKLKIIEQSYEESKAYSVGIGS